MNYKKIDHIGIAVSNLEDGIRMYTDFGLRHETTEIIDDQKVVVGILPIGESKVELIQATDSESAIAKFIDKKGEGVHHIAFRVENIEESLKNLSAKGYRLIDKKPRIGAGGAKIAFIHPKSMCNVLIELVERRR
jgi:methylmalonyl-CoA/ethylmalonyl-CoA epimerase